MRRISYREKSLCFINWENGPEHFIYNEVDSFINKLTTDLPSSHLASVINCSFSKASDLFPLIDSSNPHRFLVVNLIFTISRYILPGDKGLLQQSGQIQCKLTESPIGDIPHPC